MKKALLVIDLQKDYFEGGKFPLWNTEKILDNIKTAIKRAQDENIEIIHIRHIANPAMGVAPFFNKDTEGAEIHPEIIKAAPNAPVIVKEFADGFVQTNLAETLEKLGVTEILVSGMMTQNCVTHTAISKSAEKYEVKILPDCCTTVDEMIHNIALHAVSTRVALVPSTEAF